MVRGTSSTIYTDTLFFRFNSVTVTIVITTRYASSYYSWLCVGAIFSVSTTFPNSGIMSGFMSRCRLRSRSHVDVRANVLAMLPSSVASVQFMDGVVSLFTRF
jgi:hypothetical protein